MRTVRSISRLLGGGGHGSASVHAGIHPLGLALEPPSPRPGPGHPPNVGLDPPGVGLCPPGVGLDTPLARPPNLLLGLGLDTPLARPPNLPPGPGPRHLSRDEDKRHGV